MRKILTILGARPQFIKYGPFSEAVRRSPELVETVLHTGQHYDEKMSAVFFAELGLQAPQHRLEVGSGPHGFQTAAILTGAEKILLEESPDMVVVFGDTNTTLGGALAAAKLRIPVCHVEAGLRSFNKNMPEEVNRVLTDHMSELLMCPTEQARMNLLAEGIKPEKIHVVGDIMFDSALLYSSRAETSSRILADNMLDSRSYILVSIHRAENTDDPVRLGYIVEALREISSDRTVVFPVHPRTRKVLSARSLMENLPASLRLIEPVGYLDMLMLERNAQLIVTDSGGVQKEAYFQGVPCLTLRNETEWTELLAAGWNVLVPPVTSKAVIDAIRARLGDALPGPRDNLYGDGHSAEKIVQLIEQTIAKRLP